MEFRNPFFSGPSRIDCEIDHPSFGWIPFTATPDDTEPLGSEIYDAAVGLNLAPYVAPQPDPNAGRAAMPPLSRRQVFIGLLKAGLITEAEAMASGSATPAMVAKAILTLPVAEQAPARITFAQFTQASRLDPMVALLGAAAGMDAAAMDAFWTATAAV